ncbi:MAG TPA: RNase adapter RapZ [Azospirillaceae bacterium]|nr:RNase adapter RapZ [Azospirillaceae bacterium]HRQ80185.1 RNase adapter RapZ [Azospirillaceae bacterium]
MTGSDAQKLVVITGLSGAGMSVALKALEDLGFEAVDNLRLSLLPMLLSQTKSAGRPLAVVIDSRTRDFAAAVLLDELQALRAAPGLEPGLLYLDCAPETLQRRFTETRRRHPLAADRTVADGIERERALLAPVRLAADWCIDTTTLSLHDLRRLLGAQFALSGAPRLTVFVTSFSFRQGLPREADLVFDVRFLANPHWEPDLRPLSGLDQPVARHVAADPGFDEFFDRLTGLLRPLLPRYNREGKSYLTIAVGCTGGRHRSVFVAERLGAWLREQGIKVGVNHRDLARPDRSAAPAAGSAGEEATDKAPEVKGFG